MTESISRLENSVILPREDFYEMQEAAYAQPPMSGKDRIESVLHTTAIVAACAAAFSAASWGWAKAVNWRDEKSHQRKLKEEAAKHERDLHNPPPK